MYRSWAGVVALGRPDLGVSRVLHVVAVTHPRHANSDSANPHMSSNTTLRNLPSLVGVQ